MNHIYKFDQQKSHKHFKSQIMTSFKGYFKTSYQKLYDFLGEPVSGEGKVSTTWILKIGGKQYTIYDYKQTDLYNEDYPTVEEFRKLNSYLWHIGAELDSDASACIEHLEKKIVADEPNWIELAQIESAEKMKKYMYKGPTSSQASTSTQAPSSPKTSSPIHKS